MLWQVLFNKDNGKLLGVHIIGIHAADLIQECSNAVSAGTTVEELSMMVHTHPTLCEVLDEAFADGDDHDHNLGGAGEIVGEGVVFEGQSVGQLNTICIAIDNGNTPKVDNRGHHAGRSFRNDFSCFPNDRPDLIHIFIAVNTQHLQRVDRWCSGFENPDFADLRQRTSYGHAMFH